MIAKIGVGRITAAHGIKGEVKLVSYMQCPEDLTRQPKLWLASGVCLEKVRMRPQGRGFIAAFEGITTRDEAEKIVSCDVFIPRSLLPNLDESSHYYADLIGLKAYDDSAQTVGTITACHNFGAGDIIELDNGMMLPFTKTFVLDVQADRIIVRIPRYE